MIRMRNRHRRFVEIFRARNPLESDAFALLRDATASGDAGLVREFFVTMNDELARALDAEGPHDVGWATSVCVALTSANPDVTVRTLNALVADTTLQFHDPLLAVVFEGAIDDPALLSL